ncbi:hypothetical protein FHX81_7340 [Saccharothrix saharensis]|uniref:Uncharacterized protein n=1 Tax=Saccharothrix saharensis TaxID=571190 RepID=A0A543JPW0_9PSEU|nr:hypothetical protein [Saccharothrix saharensis]TQM84880.1 hypothetical protein FHX81_7340 [Saccharothrix saharensis]
MGIDYPACAGANDSSARRSNRAGQVAVTAVCSPALRRGPASTSSVVATALAFVARITGPRHPDAGAGLTGLLDPVAGVPAGASLSARPAPVLSGVLLWQAHPPGAPPPPTREHCAAT